MVIKIVILTKLQNHRTGKDLKSHPIQPFVAIELASKIIFILKSAQCPYLRVFYVKIKTDGYLNNDRYMVGSGERERKGRKQGRPSFPWVLLSIKFFLCFMNAYRK